MLQKRAFDRFRWPQGQGRSEPDAPLNGTDWPACAGGTRAGAPKADIASLNGSAVAGGSDDGDFDPWLCGGSAAGGTWLTFVAGATFLRRPLLKMTAKSSTTSNTSSAMAPIITA